MKTQLQVVETSPYQAYRPVILHDSTEDFTVYRTAGLVARWYALWLDLVLSAPLNVVLHLPFQRYLAKLEAYGHTAKYWGFSAALAVVLLMIYFIAPTLLFGQTLGKRIVGLRVIRANCNPEIGFFRVVLRESVGKLLSVGLLGIGFLFPLMNQRQRALHDYLAGTIVVTYRQR